MRHYSVILALLDVQISLASYRPLDPVVATHRPKNPISEHGDASTEKRLVTIARREQRILLPR